MKQDTQSDIPIAAPPRTVVYSPETTAAYGNVIDVGMAGGTAEDVQAALRYLMQMVHSDFTGELRAPHAHVVLRNGAHE